MQNRAHILRLLGKLFSSATMTVKGDPEIVAQVYLEQLEPFSDDAIERSIGQYLSGKVEGIDRQYVPSAPNLAANVRAWQEAIDAVTASRALSPPPEHGMIEVDFGAGRIDLRGKSLTEVDEIMKHKGLPPQIEGDKAMPQVRLQGMELP